MSRLQQIDNVVLICHDPQYHTRCIDWIELLLKDTNKYNISYYSCCPVPLHIEDKCEIINIKECEIECVNTIFLRHILKLCINKILQKGVYLFVRCTEIGFPDTNLLSNIVSGARSMMFDFYDTKLKSITTQSLQKAEISLLKLPLAPLPTKVILEIGSILAFNSNVFTHRRVEFYENILKQLSSSRIGELLYIIFLLHECDKRYFGL